MHVTADRLTALVEAAGALAGELSLDAILDTMVRTAATVTGARYAAIGVIGDDQTITRFLTHGTDDETVRAIGHYPTGKGLLGLLVRDPQVLRLDDLSTHPASTGFPAHHPPMRSFLGAPIRSRGRVWGNFYLTEKVGGFTEHDEQLLLVLSAQAGTAVENAELSERLQSLAVQDERDRISRELHDGVIQSLFSIGMGLESARALLATDPRRADERMNAAVDGIDGAIRELRNYIFQLRPNEAATMGLTRGLIELAREFEINALVRPHLDLQPGLDVRVPARLVPDVLQVVREALSNAAKHAGASNVTITALTDGDRLEVLVMDDGVGFQPSTPKVGRGLDNIHERAGALGGTLQLESDPGSGTALRLEVQLD